MFYTPAMSEQSDGFSLTTKRDVHMSSVYKSELDGIYNIYLGSAEYDSYTDWK